ncbi:4a-hydroxytetrahydrobiopterin dehydratase [Candidatus Gracilibacteria bacterium]|jgi:4a-hydroxytetrahydrobiopterin dehydratase|nr:4a-hydroxytetrahydrobiopterin dehydratase [Candidatus Gracilibacteria bacterium]NJM87991.1 4a-hydroxytetrahydrobiopterin dehydratase [Hydrococcus sp. RU_2_2]NJP21364.1 4a-hydroxytetrahydrobiopterin dehydratase [Hydrococcus sp. CRU_1_1]NJQ98085.1 4a-hydroxytetrahydrobiopterin dehydratase [Hydrococcus sp. CSU_1_8]
MFANFKKYLPIGIVLTGLILVNACPVWANPLTLAQTKLTQVEITEQLKQIRGWTIKEGKLQRTYEFKNFVDAIAFVNRLVEPAEAAGHHPDLIISYNRVTVSLTTHDAGGITQKDFDLAQIISRLFLEMQP